MCGVLYVTTPGKTLMHLWFADSWVTLLKVRNYHLRKKVHKHQQQCAQYV